MSFRFLGYLVRLARPRIAEVNAMPAITYYVALPFIRTEDGSLVAGEAQDRQSASAAISAAASMARTSAGAVAFSRTGDPQVGDFEDAVVLQSFGEVPSLDDLLGGG